MADDRDTSTLRGQLRAYLVNKGIDPDKPFLCLNPQHDDTTPSMTFYDRKNFVKCWSCGAIYSLFDLIGIDYNLPDFAAQKKQAAALFPTGLQGYSGPATRPRDPGGEGFRNGKNNSQNPMFAIDTLQTMKAMNQEKKGGSEMETKTQPQDLRDKYALWHSWVTQTSYWNERGINQETIDRFQLGYDPGRDVVTIPCTSAYYVARAVQDGHGPKYVNMAGVPVQLFNEIALEAALNEPAKPVWIVEGAIDALSLCQVGAHAVAMNSSSMTGILLAALDKKHALPPLILCMDPDAAGEKAAGKLTAEFEARNIAFMKVSVPEPYLDTNELLKRDSDALKAFICEIEGTVPAHIQAKAEKAREKELSELAATSFSSHLEIFYSHQASNVIIPTGFTKLDKYLGGGLQEGLIILGAQSSLGKTTLALQIANQAAKAGELVIFFSLEQSVNELIQKSISMVSGKLLTQWDVKQIAADQAEAGDSRIMVYNQAVDQLFTYGDNLHVIREARTISAMAAEVFRITALTGRAPLVIVDYLQVILPDQGDQLNEKRHNVDFNVSELKRLSADRHIPVLVISSLNRGNYETDISQAAFKESGGIEYSSDLLLGLQFQALDPAIKKQAFDHDAEMAANPREVQLKIIKQRDGIAGARINFKYHAAYNVFEEAGF